MRYFWFFLKGFVEDLLDAFWSENSVLDFLGKFFLVTEFFGQNFFFWRLCDIFGSFWRVLLKAFWMLFEVKIQFWIFWGKFFWWQNFLVIFLVRIFIFFFGDCVLYYRDSFWRVLLKTFWMLFEVKIQFWIFWGNFFWWQNFLVRIFFFGDCAIFLVLFEGFCWRPFGCFLKWKFSFGFFGENFLVTEFFGHFFGHFFGQNFYFFFVDCVLYYRDLMTDWKFIFVVFLVGDIQYLCVNMNHWAFDHLWCIFEVRLSFIVYKLYTQNLKI